MKKVATAAARVDAWEAIVLGVLQGLSEFLPVSSTAHLTLAGTILGAVDAMGPQAWTAFLAVVQLGTLAAVLAYFAPDLAAMTRATIRVPARRATPEDRDAWRLLWLLALGTLPIAIVGLALEDVIEGPLTKDLRIIGAALILLGLLLGAADRYGKRELDIKSIGWRDALLVGACQVMSLVPGASRSGTTLTGGLFAGLTREAAARYSFLLSIPAIAASGLYELPTALEAATDDLTALLLATTAAALSGYLAIAGLLRWLRTRSTAAFVAYRVVLGAGVVAWAVM